jgi:hypothetical protein
MGDSGWSVGSRAWRGGEYRHRRPRAHDARSKQWQRPLGWPLSQAGQGKTCENRIRPMAIRENKKSFIFKSLIIYKPIQIQIKFER